MAGNSRTRRSLAMADAPGQSVVIGCLPCPLREEECGGIAPKSHLYSCRDHCRCEGEEVELCPLVCPNSPRRLVAATREVNGFALDLLPARPLGAVELPALVPILCDGSRFEGPLALEAVAVPLGKTFHGRTGEPRFQSRNELLDRFRLRTATHLVISGVSQEQPIEWFWTRARKEGIYESIRRLNPALVTVPNFSVWVNVPREDNLYNMKRIAIVWREMADAGIPAALHPNARTPHDWNRWAHFLRAHPEIVCLSYEFTTGGKPQAGGDRHVAGLVALARKVDRPLRIVIRGGLRYMRRLQRSFSSVTHLTSAPQMAAKNGRCLSFDSLTGRIRQQPVALDRTAPLNHLFGQNLEAYRSRLLAIPS